MGHTQEFLLCTSMEIQQPCKVMLDIPATPALRSKEGRDRTDPWDCVADTLTEKLVAADLQEQVKSDRRVPGALFCSTHTLT